jgi:pyroglutamyl-peptidase
MPRLLVTGFDAFGGRTFNPAEAIVRRLAAAPPVGDFHALVLPTVYAEAARLTIGAVEDLHPDLVVMFGLAETAAGLRLERFGLNSIDAPLADNAGAARAGEPVVPGAAAAFATSIDVHALASRVATAVPDVSVSSHAGGYVCNHLYCSVLHAIESRGLSSRALFVHVPWTYRPRTAADFAEAPLDVHERVARRVIGGLLAE